MIDKTRIVSEGDVAKFRVVISHTDFHQDFDAYKVILTWGAFGRSLTIDKADMLIDEDGSIYMVFDSTGMIGMVKAMCIYDVEDSDMASGTRKEVNFQWLCFVTSNPTPLIDCDFDAGGDGHVTYTRVYGGDVNTAYLNLRDSGKNNLLDSDGNQLRVHKTNDDYNDN